MGFLAKNAYLVYYVTNATGQSWSLCPVLYFQHYFSYNFFGATQIGFIIQLISTMVDLLICIFFVGLTMEIYLQWDVKLIQYNNLLVTSQGKKLRPWGISNTCHWNFNYSRLILYFYTSLIPYVYPKGFWYNGMHCF